MTCQFDNEKVKQIQTAVPNHRAAVKIYLLADKQGGNIDENISNIVKYVVRKRKEQPKSRREAEALLKELNRAGYIYHNGKSNDDSFYKTNGLDELAYFILENKKNFFYIRYGVIDPDNEYQQRPYLYFSTNKGKTFAEEPRNYKDPHPEIKDEMDVEFESIGTNLLGKTLISLNNKISRVQQNQIVDTIAERIAREVLALNHRGDSLKSDGIDKIFNEYKSLFDTLLADAKEDLASAIEDEDAEDIEYFTKHSEHLQEIVDNYNNLKGVVISTLKSRSGLKVSGGVSSSTLQVKEEENQAVIEENSETQLEDGARERASWSDDFSITLDSKNTLSTRLKLFLSFIKSNKKHYLGDLFDTDTYEKFDQVYNNMSAMLAGEEPVWENIENGIPTGMKHKLLSFKEAFPWVEELVRMVDDRINIGDTQIVHEIVTAMNKHYIPMEYTSYSNKGGVFLAKVQESNSNSTTRMIIDMWNNFMLGNGDKAIIYDANGNPIYNKEFLQSTIEKMDELSDRIDEIKGDKKTIDWTGRDAEFLEVLRMIQNAYADLGMIMSDTTVKSLLNNGLRYNTKTIPIESLFNKKVKDSLYGYVIAKNGIKSVVDSKTDVKYEVGSSLDLMKNGIVKALIKLEAKNTNRYFSNSHKAGNKTVFSYTNDKFIIDRFYEIRRALDNGDKSILDQFKKDVFARDSLWLKYMEDMGSDAMKAAFNYAYIDLSVLKEAGMPDPDRSLTDMVRKELLVEKLAKFYNNDSKQDQKRVGKMFYLTMSDKSNMLTIDSILREISFDYIPEYIAEKNALLEWKNNALLAEDADSKQINKEYNESLLEVENKWSIKKTVDERTIDLVFDHVVKSELNRMIAVKKATSNYSNDLIDIEAYTEGSRYFYFIPELNALDSIFTKDENNKRMLRFNSMEEIENNDNILNEIKGQIKASLNSMVSAQIAEFKREGIGYTGTTGQKFIDANYAKYIADKYENPTSQDVTDGIAADFAINYFLHNINLYQMFVGDPAMYFKGKSAKSGEAKMSQEESDVVEAAYEIVRDTFDNIGKRLAADLAPGYEADYTIAGERVGNSFQYARKDFNVLVVEDFKVPSKTIDFISEVFSGHPAQKNIVDSYSDINSTDAQSWASIDFFLDTLNAFGSSYITPEEYKSMKKKVSDWKNGKGELIFDKNELKIILNPIKPVYVNSRMVALDQDGFNNSSVRSYIKTSTIPLVPQLVKGTELEPLMKEALKNGVDLIAFESAYKVGATNNVRDVHGGVKSKGKLQLFDKTKNDGSLNPESIALMKSNMVTLPIKGFKIQQDVPYHDHPGVVNDGTQQRKLLFNGIKGFEGFEYHGQENLKGSDLEKIFVDLYKKIYAQEAEKLEKEIYINGKLNIEKLKDLLVNEAESRNYSINDIIGLAVDSSGENFKFPLWAMPASNKYESLLLSIIDNRVRKLKVPGASYVLGTESGFKVRDDQSEVYNKYRDGIIYTSNYDHKKGLQSFRKSEDGKTILKSQVFVPCKIDAGNGKFINIQDFTKKVDGRVVIDEDRLPKDLLNIFGFRIPTQGHNSMAAIEIAGFLPDSAGDLIIATQDFIKQMGSDFDVDKLYTYNYSTKKVLKDNPISQRIKELQDELNISEEDLDINDEDSEESFWKTMFGGVSDAAKQLELDKLKTELKVFKSNRENWIVVKNDKKSLFNDLLDVHFSVFNNPNQKLWQMILEPNGFGELKRDDGSGVADDIYKIVSVGNKINYASQQYQVQKFLNGTSGKAGTGVFSSASMLLAMMQGKNIRYVSTNEKGRDAFKIKFGNTVTTDGDLSGTHTLNGQINKLRSKVIEAFQSASVDNEKEQILHKLNINQHTFNAINALAMLGFDEATISYFISQPIIQEYVIRAANQNSSLNDFTENFNADIFEAMIEDYSERNGILRQEDGWSSADSANYDSAYEISIEDDNSVWHEEGLKSMLEGGRLRLNSNKDRDFVVRQIAILNKFKKINSIGTNLQGLMQTVNVDSKGVGKTFHSPIARENKVDSINKTTDAYNKGKEVSGIYNAGEILKDSIPGIVTDNTGKYAIGMADKLFLNNHGLLVNVLSYLKDTFGEKAQSISTEEDFNIKMFNEIKSYLFSSPLLFGINNVEETRGNLFIDEWYYEPRLNNGRGKLVLTKPSLASKLRAIQDNSNIKKNPFLRQLSTKIMHNGSASLISYRASTGLNLDETEMHQAFLDLYKNDRLITYKLPDKANKESISSREFVKELIIYSYLSGGIQEAIQFIRYIPVEILSHMGFDTKIKQVADEISLDTIATILNGDGGVDVSFLAEQIIQHNPKMLPVKLKANMTFAKDGKPNFEKDGVKVLDSELFNINEDGQSIAINVVTSFEPSENSDYLFKKVNGKPVPIDYVSVRANTGSGSTWLLYKLDKSNADSIVYNIIPTLGTHGMKEYNAGAGFNTVRSNINSHNIGWGVKPQAHVPAYNGQSSSLSSLKQSFYKKYDFSDAPMGWNVVELNLEELAKPKDGEVSEINELASELLKNKQILESLTSYSVKIDTTTLKDSRGKHNFSGETIVIYTKDLNGGEKFKSTEDFEKTLIHEILHAYTSKVINAITSRNRTEKQQQLYDSLSKKSIEAYKSLELIRRGIKYQLLSSGQISKEAEAATKKWMESARTDKDAAEYSTFRKSNPQNAASAELAYSFGSVEEMITNVLTKKHLKDKVDKSTIDKIIEFIKDLLGISGDKVSEILRNTTFEFISEIEESFKSTEKVKPKDTSEIDEKLAVIENELRQIVGPEVKPEVKEVEVQNQNSSNRVSLLNMNYPYTKETPESDRETGFIFTENAEAYLFSNNMRNEQNSSQFPLYPSKPKINVTATNNQAGIRTNKNGIVNKNAVGITVKKYQQDKDGFFVKQEGSFTDSDSDFKMFIALNNDAFSRLKQFKKIVVPGQFALGKAALPLRFAEWLKDKLESELGVKTEILENKTSGYSGFGLNVIGLNQSKEIQKPQQANFMKSTIEKIFSNDSDESEVSMQNVIDNNGNKVSFKIISDEEAGDIYAVVNNSEGKFIESIYMKNGDVEGFANEISARYKQTNIEESDLDFSEVKEGVDFVFEQNPELSKTGTPEQYSQYLDTIFPDSKVKDIVTHTTNVEFDEFISFDYKESNGVYGTDEGIYFSKNPNYYTDKGRKVNAILNLKNPKNYRHEVFMAAMDASGIRKSDFKDKGYDGFITMDYFEPEFHGDEGENKLIFAVALNSEQIHILGSKQDIEGFKGFVENNSLLTEELKQDLIKKHGENAIEVFNSLTEEERMAIIKCL